MASIAVNHVETTQDIFTCENSFYGKEQTKCTAGRKFIFIIRPQKYVHNVVQRIYTYICMGRQRKYIKYSQRNYSEKWSAGLVEMTK